MTNREAVGRNIGLTFDFVNHLIDNHADLEKLPESFTIEFVEKDFPKLQHRLSKSQAPTSLHRKFVHVRNSFVTA